jgi:hypothetical protein
MESVNQARKIKQPDEPLAPATRAVTISTIAVFFQYATLAEWDDMPARIGVVGVAGRRGTSAAAFAV